MKPCFVASAPLPLGQTSVQTKSTRCARVRMSAAEGGEKKSFGDWLFNKIMHNNDDAYGFEPAHKEAMSARDQEKKKAYNGMGTDTEKKE